MKTEIKTALLEFGKALIPAITTLIGAILGALLTGSANDGTTVGAVAGLTLSRVIG